jgi:NAD(P)-dependent dehydrogenase (short-subunit alcohol dehydrogenase family)
VNVLVVGGSGGIGQALVSFFCNAVDTVTVTATYRSNKPSLANEKLKWVALDVTDEEAMAELFASCPDLTYIINAVGLLHAHEGKPEKTINKLDPDFFMDNIRVNTLSTLLIAKHAKPALKKASRSVFAVLSARVGSISDNQLGGWYSYRCSKAALNMAVKTLSVEWKRTLPNCAVVALHPGTVTTELSAPFVGKKSGAKLFTPVQSAGWLADIIVDLQAEDTGRFIAFDGSDIEW